MHEKMITSADTPLLTVITATFNLVKAGREQAFRQCAESVRAQTCAARIEHLVIDGGSSDGTRELVAEYESEGLLRCISEPDEGIYDAMNKGLAAAKGKYIAFLNSDDYWHDPQGAERSLAALELAHGDFSYAPVTLLGEDGSRRAEEPEIGGAFSGMPFCHQSMVTRTDLLRRLGGFRKEMFRCAADYDVVLRLLVRGAHAVYVPCNFTTFRIGGFSSGDDVWKQEIPAAVHAVLDPVFGAEAAGDIHAGLFDERSLKALGSLLHPVVFAELKRSLEAENMAPHVLCRQKDYDRSISEKQVRGPLGLSLGCIRCEGHTLRWVWCGIPILVTRYASAGASCRLFGLLPLWGRKVNNYGSVTFCVLGVPVCGVKWKRRR